MKKSVKLEDLRTMIIQEAEKIISLGQPTDVEMNKMDRVDNSDGKAYVKSDAKGFVKKAPKSIEKTEEPTDVKMNEMDKEQGHDEKISAATEVKAATSTKSGDSIEGMHNSTFESKKDNPSTESSTPFEDRKKEVNMNEMDKDDKEGVDAKTFVKPGSELKKGDSTGQAKAEFSKEAKNDKETKERIAKAIQLPESFKNKSELLNFINEEAKKIAKSNLLKEAHFSPEDNIDEVEYFIGSYVNGNFNSLPELYVELKNDNKVGELIQRINESSYPEIKDYIIKNLS